MSEAGLAIFTPGRKKKKKRSGLWPSVRKWAHCSVRQGQGCDGADQGTSGVSSRRKSTTKGRALLWYYCLLFAAHDAEWHKEDASALVLQVEVCGSWQGISQLSLHKDIPAINLQWAQSWQVNRLSGTDTHKSHTEGFLTKACEGDIL